MGKYGPKKLRIWSLSRQSQAFTYVCYSLFRLFPLDYVFPTEDLEHYH